MATQPSLKSVGKLFSDTWKLYTKHMNALALVGVIPLIFYGAKMVLQPGFIAGYGYPLSVTIILLVAAAIFALLHLIFTLVLPLSLAQAVDEGHRAKPIEVASVYKRAFAEIIQYIFILMLVIIVVVGGGVLFVIPGIIAAIYLKFAIFTYLFEDKRGMDALVTSAWYVRGSWWAIFFRQLLLAVVLCLAALIFAVVVGVVLISIGLGGTVFSMLFQLFAFMILIPFGMVYLYLMYKDAKSIKDGKEPDKAFIDESEQLFIILLIVAAVAMLVFFLMASYGHSRWNIQVGMQSFGRGSMTGEMNGGYYGNGYGNGMMRRSYYQGY